MLVRATGFSGGVFLVGFGGGFLGCFFVCFCGFWWGFFCWIFFFSSKMGVISNYYIKNLTVNSAWGVLQQYNLPVC